MKRNILIGKIGKAVKFTNNKIEKGGGNEMMLFSTMARMHPDWNFWIVGPNELDKIDKQMYNTMFPDGNVKSLYAAHDGIRQDKFEPILDNMKKLGIYDKLDCAIFLSGLTGNTNCPDFLCKPDGQKYKQLCAHMNYAGPYIYTLNMTNVPFFCLAEDARYITINGQDLCNRERLVLSQWNGEVTSRHHILSLDDLVTQKPTKHKVVYADIEKIPLLGVSPDWKEHIDIEKKITAPVKDRFIVLSNGCGTAKINQAGNNSSRLPVYKKWVYEATKGTEYEGAIVYGSWDEEIYEQYPWIVKKFIVDMDEEISKCKYTLVYSQVRGFVTAKAYEMITLGIIPFIHPDYDPERLLGLPEFLFVNSPEEMIKKMRKLDSDDEMYVKALKKCMDVIKPEWLDGSYLVNGIFRKISENLGWNENTDAKGVPNIFNHFSKEILKPIEVNTAKTSQQKNKKALF